jgi:hypothetical protein
MEPTRVEIGAVRQWAHSDRPFRILALSHDVVMYDSWWPDLGDWGLADLAQAKRGRVSYSVATAATVAEKSTFVRSAPLTDAESSLYRPDLPFASVQSTDLSWPAQAPESAESFASRWPADSGRGTDVLASPEVYLFAFGPKGGERGGVLVKADNGASFRGDELVWKATVVQAPFVRAGASAHGIGIYRSGLNRGIPAYYLWGARSRLHDQIASAAKQTVTD